MRISVIGTLGFLLLWVVVAVGIAFGGVGIAPYISVASIFITVGGVIFASFIAAPTGFFYKMWSYFGIAFKKVDFRYVDTIDVLVTLSDKARRDGLLALEDNIADLSNEFMRKGLQMVVDGTDPDVIKRTLTIQVEEMQSRHSQVQDTIAFMGRVVPAFGLIGTIIGLVALLGNIGGDPAAIGRGMQTALITTLYGTMLANMVFIPITNRLKEIDVEEYRLYSIITEGVLSVQSGDNPRILKDRLLSFLSSDVRAAILIGE